MKGCDASLAAVAGQIAGDRVGVLPVPPRCLRRDAPKSDAWDEAHPDAEMGLDAMALASAQQHAGRSAGWNWELPTDRTFVANVSPLDVEDSGAAEPFLEPCSE